MDVTKLVKCVRTTTESYSRTVVSMEPMISVENIGGFRHADMFLITADGSELLTTFDNGLLVKS